MSGEALISVVVLSYNRAAYLAQSLESLKNQSYQNLEIIVVDNPSPASDEVERVVNDLAGVKLLKPARNLGYAAGMNVGIENSNGGYVCLTEDDVVLQPDCIEVLFKYLRENPSADLIAPILYNETSRTIRCAGGKLDLGGVYRREIFGSNETDKGQFPKPFEVGYIDGAIMFSRRNFWQRFKGFREEYFMYVDAVELCTRVTKARKRMMVIPSAKAYHFEPAANPTPEALEFHKLKNFFSLYLLHAPARILPEFFCRYAILNGVRTLLGKNGSNPKTFFKALLWVARAGPSLLKERYARHA